MGKHTKSIISSAWNHENHLACGSDDHTVGVQLIQFSISNTEGDTLFQMAIKGEPTHLQWYQSQTGKNVSQNVLSMVLHSKTLFFHNTADTDAPIELAFQSKYGTIVTYSWFGDRLIMIGFSNGFLVVISTSKVVPKCRARRNRPRIVSNTGAQGCIERLCNFKSSQ